MPKLRHYLLAARYLIRKAVHARRTLPRPVGPSIEELIARGRITPFQAAHLSPDALDYLQRKRRERVKAIKHNADRRAARRANRKPITVVDVLGHIAMGLAWILAIAVVAGAVLGIESWPMWGGR